MTPRPMDDADLERRALRHSTRPRAARCPPASTSPRSTRPTATCCTVSSRRLSNRRSDRYGGDLEGRMRFPLEIARIVREAWPADKPVFFRCSSVDNDAAGWTIDDSVVAGAAAGGAGHRRGRLLLRRHRRLRHRRRDGAARPRFPGALRRADHGAKPASRTMAVGLIIDPAQARGRGGRRQGGPGRDRARGAPRPQLARACRRNARCGRQLRNVAASSTAGG